LKQDSSSGYTALRERAAIADRAGYGRILLTGADRRSYLQGLLTNDIEALTPGTGCYATMLTAQGRMMTDMRVLELGDAVLLDVPAEVTAAIRDHFDRFIFAEDVKVEDVTATRVELGLYGPDAVRVLQAVATEGSAPATLFGVSRVRIADAQAFLVRTDDPVPGFDIVLAAADAAGVRERLLAAGAAPATDADLEIARIESGRPRFGIDMDNETIPLEAGLEERAISRSKGCYVGQEVIVRVQDRGHGRVAKRLVAMTFNADAPVPARNSTIRAGEREVGKITSATWSPALARPIALGYLHRDFTAAGTHVAIDGAEGVVTALPVVTLQ